MNEASNAGVGVGVGSRASDEDGGGRRNGSRKIFKFRLRRREEGILKFKRNGYNSTLSDADRILACSGTYFELQGHDDNYFGRSLLQLP
jgi:hypothetical protein